MAASAGAFTLTGADVLLVLPDRAPSRIDQIFAAAVPGVDVFSGAVPGADSFAGSAANDAFAAPVPGVDAFSAVVPPADEFAAAA